MFSCEVDLLFKAMDLIANLQGWEKTLIKHHRLSKNSGSAGNIVWLLHFLKGLKVEEIQTMFDNINDVWMKMSLSCFLTLWGTLYFTFILNAIRK